MFLSMVLCVGVFYRAVVLCMNHDGFILWICNTYYYKNQKMDSCICTLCVHIVDRLYVCC